MTVASPQQGELAMAGVARLVSLGFLPPSPEVRAEMLEAAHALAVVLPEGDLCDAVDALRGAIPDPDALVEMAGEHHRLFSGSVACPPYESSYAPDPFQQARQMADIAGFYRAFGAEPSGPAADRPDQVGCELEFLAFLMATRVEAVDQGREEDAAVCAAAEETFLREHLGRWLGPLCLELEKVTVQDTYRALARLGQRYAVAELGRRGLTADPVLARRIRTVVEHDSFACGAEEGGAGAALDGVLGRRGRGPTAGG